MNNKAQILSINVIIVAILLLLVLVVLVFIFTGNVDWYDNDGYTKWGRNIFEENVDTQENEFIYTNDITITECDKQKFCELNPDFEGCHTRFMFVFNKQRLAEKNITLDDFYYAIYLNLFNITIDCPQKLQDCFVYEHIN